MTINDLWNLCETQRKRGFGDVHVRVYKRDSDAGGVLWGPFGIDRMLVDPVDGSVTFEVADSCRHCGRP